MPMASTDDTQALSSIVSFHSTGYSFSVVLMLSTNGASPSSSERVSRESTNVVENPCFNEPALTFVEHQFNLHFKVFKAGR